MRWLPVLPSGDRSTGDASVGSKTLPAGALGDALVDGAPQDALLTADASAAVPFERRVWIEVFGCQMNKLDSELLLDVLLDGGYALCDRLEDAGVILYNTCAIREQAENKVFSKVGQLKALKRRRPDVVIGVLGCGAQNHQHDIFRRYPHVGIVCGPGEFLRLPDLIDEARRVGQVAALRLDTPVRTRRTANLGPNPYQAFISVMRGCDMVCTYCVVPKTRGPEISRPVRDIIDEAKVLVDAGVREITLLGQTVNSYGKRLGRGRSIGLQHVLHELDKIAGLERIRFITSHPRFMNPELIDAMASLEKVTEYLHLPVQSGSDNVLRRMQRSYSTRHYRKVIEQCRERIPDLALATDWIVGFCGETDAEFEESVQLLREMRYQGSFIFRYSERAGTAAAALPDDVPEDVKRERNQILLDVQQEISREVYRASVGRETEVLVEGVSKKDANRWSGRNRRHQIVVFPKEPAADGSSVPDLTGKLVPVRVVDATPLVLVGEQCGAAS